MTQQERVIAGKAALGLADLLVELALEYGAHSALEALRDEIQQLCLEFDVYEQGCVHDFH